MFANKAFLLSMVLHLGLILVLGARLNFSWPHKKEMPAVEAHLVFKAKVRDKELLPKKHAPNQAAAEKMIEKTVTLEQKVLAPIHAQSKKVAAKHNYSKELASLSKMFNQELHSKKTVELISEAPVEHSYFDQIYTLIKESFIVPPHVNGPAGYKLQAVVRLFLLADGSLSDLKLEQSSGDEHFDKAVLEGTKRVANFGSVPILLQGLMRERGVVVELCPFTCAGP